MRLKKSNRGFKKKNEKENNFFFLIFPQIEFHMSILWSHGAYKFLDYSLRIVSVNSQTSYNRSQYNYGLLKGKFLTNAITRSSRKSNLLQGEEEEGNKWGKYLLKIIMETISKLFSPPTYKWMRMLSFLFPSVDIELSWICPDTRIQMNSQKEGEYGCAFFDQMTTHFS